MVYNHCGVIGKIPQYYTPRINAGLGKMHYPKLDIVGQDNNTQSAHSDIDLEGSIDFVSL